MRISVPALFTCFALLVGCHKNDVDIADLKTNPFDRDHPGESTLFTVEPIQTVAYGQGTLHKQTVVVQVHPEQFPATVAYTLRFIELTVPDTTVLHSGGASNNTFLCSNYLITLGTEYCYRFELVVGGEVITAKERCAMAIL